MINYNIIPKSWQPLKLGEVCKVRNGYAFKSTDFRDNGVLLFRQTNLDGKNVKLKNAVYLPEEYLEKFKDYVIVKGDVLIGMSGSIGKICVYNLDKPALQNQRTGLLRFTSVVENKFIRYYFEVIEQEFVKKSKGVAVLNISDKDIQESNLHLPPPPEQHRIVAKIEELFSSLDKGIESLKTAQQQLKVYRQAVLKWAFEGNWEVSEFGAVAEINRGKSKHRPRDAKELLGGPYPFIQTGKVRAANGGTIKTYTQTYSEIGLAQSKLWPKGTLCLTIAANIAETAFLGFDACFPDSIVGIKTDENNLSIKYVNFYIQKLKQEIDSKASATAQKNINVEFLKNIPIPIPQIEEQHSIVAEIESRLSVCDKIEESIEQSLKQSEALRQSILKKAFEGKLVPQNPSDEPASKLLERIKAERAKIAAEQRNVNSQKRKKIKSAP